METATRPTDDAMILAGAERYVFNGSHVRARPWPGDLSTEEWDALGVFHRSQLEGWTDEEWKGHEIERRRVRRLAGNRGLSYIVPGTNAWAWVTGANPSDLNHRGTGYPVGAGEWIVENEKNGQRTIWKAAAFDEYFELAAANSRSEMWYARFKDGGAAQEHRNACKSQARQHFGALLDEHDVGGGVFGVDLSEDDDDVRVNLDGTFSRTELDTIWAQALEAKDFYTDLLTGVRELDE